MNKLIKELNNNNFNDTVKGYPNLMAVQFGAPWCGTCGTVKSHLGELSMDTRGEGKWAIGYVNVDEAPETAHEFGVMSIPTVIFFKGGEVVRRFTGTRPYEAVEEMFLELAEVE